MSGILLFALIAVACLLLLKALLQHLKPKRPHSSPFSTAQSCALPYAAKKSLFSLAERNFLSVLEIALAWIIHEFRREPHRAQCGSEMSEGLRVLLG